MAAQSHVALRSSALFRAVCIYLCTFLLSCVHLHAPMQGSELLEALAMFIGIPVEQQVKAHRPFSQENFLGALILFIIATDQVFFSFKNLKFFLIFSLRQLGLWRDKNSANFASSFAL